MSIMAKIVDLELKLFQIQLPANGSIYHTTFLESREAMAKVPLDSAGTNGDEYCGIKDCGIDSAHRG